MICDWRDGKGGNDPWPLSDVEAMAACLDAVRRGDAASMPAVSPDSLPDLRAAADNLRFRTARPVVNPGANAVTQDFEMCESVPFDGPFGACAKALERLVNAGLARLSPPPCPPVEFNELVVQRYRPVPLGISPHRDHLRYVNLVGILVISGAGRFYICGDRAGSNRREIPAPAGSLVLMRAPGFGGEQRRPFHMLGEVARERLILGLRQDTRRPEAS